MDLISGIILGVVSTALIIRAAITRHRIIALKQQIEINGVLIESLRHDLDDARKAETNAAANFLRDSQTRRNIKSTPIPESFRKAFDDSSGV
jgi:hypothetical protein